jgi:hypothetical protein
VRVLLAALLAKGDVATLRGFVTQLPGAVLADVVLANMEHLPASPPASEGAPAGPGPGPGLAALLTKLDGPDAAAAAATATASETAAATSTASAAASADPRQQDVKSETIKAEKDAGKDTPAAPNSSRCAVTFFCS